MNKWKIAIGDPSGDGHSMCEYYIISSNYTVQEAREAYFKAVEESGVDVGETFADEYEEPYVTKEILDKLPQELVQLFKDNGYIEKDDWIDNNDDEYYDIPDPESMVHIVMQFIKHYNPSFEYSIVQDDIPTFQFCGFDEKKRHIHGFGYGLFWN